MSNAASWSVAETFVLSVVNVLAFVIAVGLVAWLDVKLTARKLFRDIDRELGIGGRSSR